MSASKTTKNQTKQFQANRRAMIALLILALLIFYVVAPQLRYFHNSLATVLDADKSYLGIGVLLVASSYLFAAGTYRFLAYFNLNYWRTVLIQVADGFTNRLLPAGAGAIATNIVYLGKGRSKTKASTIVGLNGFIGFAGHMVLLLCLLFINAASGGSQFNISLPKNIWPIVIVAGVVVILSLLFRRRLKSAVPKNLNSIGQVVSFVILHPKRLVLALASSMMVTVCYSLVLYAVMLALNVHLSYLQAFLVLTVGVAASAITPTPGGIGGVEAGLIASQISLGVPSNQALSVALVYRALTYWLPLLPGLLAFRIAIKKKYLVI